MLKHYRRIWQQRYIEISWVAAVAKLWIAYRRISLFLVSPMQGKATGTGDVHSTKEMTGDRIFVWLSCTHIYWSLRWSWMLDRISQTMLNRTHTKNSMLPSSASSLRIGRCWNPRQLASGRNSDIFISVLRLLHILLSNFHVQLCIVCMSVAW